MATHHLLAKSNAEGPDRITGRILSFITAHALAAGDRMPSERELAQRFGASRTAVREALARLQAMRVVERRPNSGIYLGKLDADSSFEALVLHSDLGLPVKHAKILQSMEVRHLLELQAVQLACQRRSTDDVVAMRAILAEQDNRVRHGLNIAEQDMAFHLAIIAATQNHVFVQIVNAFYRLSNARRKVYFNDLERSRRSLAQHKKILRAIEGQDVARGMALMNHHIGDAESYWRTVVRPGKSQGKAARGPGKTARRLRAKPATPGRAAARARGA